MRVKSDTVNAPAPRHYSDHSVDDLVEYRYDQVSTETGAFSRHPLMRLQRIQDSAATWGVILVFALAFIAFATARPSIFLTWSNVATILNSGVINGLLAVALVCALIMNDFDLSIGAMASLSSAMAIVLVALHGWTTPSAIAIAIALGLIVGTINGLLSAGSGASSFIITLAMGSVLEGLQYLLTGQATIVQGIPRTFLEVGQSRIIGLDAPVFVVLVIVIIGSYFLSHTSIGRQVYAIGSNKQAAHVTGINVRRVRVGALIVSAIVASIAGIFIASMAGSSFPDAGNPYLLTAFAAAFLGSVIFPKRRFSITGAFIAAILLQMISTGLVELNFASWTTYVFDGVVLMLAVLVAVKSGKVRLGSLGNVTDAQ